MIAGIGVDIIEIARIAHVIDRYGMRFLDKICTPEEIVYCQGRPTTTAGLFAAKEAIVKAIGTGFQHDITFKDIGITRNAQGKPMVHFSERLQQRLGSPCVHITISHSKESAVACAVWERYE